MRMTHEQTEERLNEYHPHIDWTYRVYRELGSRLKVRGSFKHEIAGDETIFVYVDAARCHTVRCSVSAFGVKPGTGNASDDNPELAVLEAVADFIRNNKEE